MSRPLGLASGLLADERFTASSVYRAAYSLFNPWLGRAHAKHAPPSDGYWRAGEAKVGEWLQVDLGRDYMVTAVATQGAATGVGWVTKYQVQTSRDGVAWKTYPRDMRGNADGDTTVLNDLHEAVAARYVRLVAMEWSGAVAMRAEVYGYSPECAGAEDERVVGVPCAKPAGQAAAARRGAGEGEAALLPFAPARPYAKGFPLGLEAGIIADGALSASSEYTAPHALREDAACVAAAGAAAAARPARFASVGTEAGEALVTVAHAGLEAEGAPAALAAAAHARFADDAADPPFVPPGGVPDCGVRVSYAAKFGRLNALPLPYKSGGWKAAAASPGEYLQVDLGSVQEVDAVATQGREGSEDWVTVLTLDYSLNGRTWETVPGSFAANSDPTTLVKHVLHHPLLTRYLRFVVQAWNGGGGRGGIGLRAEVYGPGRGQGCMLRCHAAKLAVSAGVHDIEAVMAAANGAAFLETAAGVEVAAALGLGVDAAPVVSCCGCACCSAILPDATCRSGGGGSGDRDRKGGSRGGALSIVEPVGGGAAVPVAAVGGASAADVASTLRVLLRGGTPHGGEAPAFAGSGTARTAVAAEDVTVAAAVKVPGGAGGASSSSAKGGSSSGGGAKTYYGGQRED